MQFDEKDTPTKLQILIRKALYPLAITLAVEEKCDTGEVVQLYKLYAEYLYDKEVVHWK